MMRRRRRLAPLALVLLLAVPPARAPRLPDAPRLTGPEPFTKETPAPPLRREMADDLRRQRNY